MKYALGLFLLVSLAGCTTPGFGPASGGDPANVPVGVQGAQFQQGQQGQVGETGSAVVYANPTVYAFRLMGQKSKVRVVINDEGSLIEATSEGDMSPEDLALLMDSGGVTVSYGDNAISNYVSSGGAGAAGVEGGVGR